MTTVTEIMQATVGVRSRSKRPPMWSLCKVVARAAVVNAIALGSGAGCTASSDDVKPDAGRLFFPTGAAMSPDGMRLFVANANSDLTFDSGSIAVVPIPSVEAVVTGWLSMAATVPPDLCGDDNLDNDDDEVLTACCERDPDFTETLVCNERLFLEETRDAGVRIGNFATDLAIQDLSNGALRLVVPTRGDPSVAWADWIPGESRLSCNTSGEGFALCDNEHRLAFAFNDDDAAALPDEPFGVFADSAGEFAIVTHLTTGSVTLIDSPRGGSAQITDIQQNIFEADPTTGLRGATGVAGRTPQAPGDIIYVGSRSEDRIQTFTVGRPINEASPFLLQGSWFFLNGVGNNTNTNSFSSDTRGMAFSPTGNRLYLLNRKPPTLQILDTSLGPTGVPLNQLVGAVDICRQASTVTVVDAGDGERAYLTCFQDGQIYVVDPRGRGHVEDVITVGRGPYSVAAAPNGQRLYVTNFLEDTIAVIDLTPGSPTRHRVVLRLGEPRPL
jgi:DNA-binding beta-propeller fold protein YncE